MLYPASSRLLLGLLGTATTVSSMLPVFLYLSVATSSTFYRDTMVVLQNIMVIWGTLTMISMVICVFIGPWYNLEHFPKGETLLQLISKDIKIKSSNLKRTDPGFMGKFKVRDCFIFFCQGYSNTPSRQCS